MARPSQSQIVRVRVRVLLRAKKLGHLKPANPFWLLWGNDEYDTVRCAGIPVHTLYRPLTAGEVALAKVMGLQSSVALLQQEILQRG